jgi:hypothetical protein
MISGMNNFRRALYRKTFRIFFVLMEITRDFRRSLSIISVGWWMECTIEHIIDKRGHPLAAEIDVVKNRFIGKSSEILLITELLFCHKNIRILESWSSSLFLYFESFLPPYTELIAESYINSLFFCFKLNIYWGMPFEFLRIVSIISIEIFFSAYINGTDVNKLFK